MKMLKYDDIPQMTIRELGDLAQQVRAATPGTRRARQLADWMAAATFYLEGSGVLAQGLWWAQKRVEAEAPPGMGGQVVELEEKRSLFLVK